MEFEIVEFYPSDKEHAKKRLGTLHIRIKTIGIELRGINVFHKRGNLAIFMPKGLYYHEESKTVRYYPIFTMLDKEKYGEFLDKFIPEAKKYVRQKLGIQEKNIDENTKES